MWQGGNGWDEMVREQLEESTIRQRLGGRRDSAAQISAASPPSTSPPPGKSTNNHFGHLNYIIEITIDLFALQAPNVGVAVRWRS